MRPRKVVGYSESIEDSSTKHKYESQLGKAKFRMDDGMYRKPIVFNIAFILIVIVLASVFLNAIVDGQGSVSSSNDWWSDAWMLRRKVSIVETSGYSLVNFPVEVSFKHDGNITADGRDIRVMENDTEIPFCITELNSTWATVMFEINATALSTKSTHIYYENSAAPTPNYPLTPLTISEGNNGHAIIDNSVHIGWAYTSWGWSNNVELWNDFRVDFNGNNDPADDSDLITNYGSRTGGVGRRRRDIDAIGLGEYQGFTQNPIYVDINFADATLRVCRNQRWVETTQADVLHIFGVSWKHANYATSSEQNIIDGAGWTYLVRDTPETPQWMAFRDSASGNIIGSVGLNKGSEYNCSFGAKEDSDWDRVVYYDAGKGFPNDSPRDQPADCRIYWYADDSNGYSEINKTAVILGSPPVVSVLTEEVIPEFPSFLILPIFIIATLVTVIVYRRKHST